MKKILIVMMLVLAVSVSIFIDKPVYDQVILTDEYTFSSRVEGENFNFEDLRVFNITDSDVLLIEMTDVCKFIEELYNAKAFYDYKEEKLKIINQYLLNGQNKSLHIEYEFDYEKNIVVVKGLHRLEDAYWKEDNFNSNLDYEIIDKDSSKTIMFSNYEIDIFQTEEQRFIPIEVFEVLFINYYKLEKIENEIVLNRPLLSPNHYYLNNSDNHDKILRNIALRFDLFYGLPDKLNSVAGAREKLLKSTHVDSDEFDEIVSEFVNSLEDGHTIYFKPNALINEKATDEQLLWNCNQRKETTSKDYGNLFYVDFPVFHPDFKIELNPLLKEAQEYEYAVIDLSCNLGGYSYVLEDILSRFTNGKYQVKYKMEEYEYEIIKKVDKKEFFPLDLEEIYIITSSNTYSAAHILSVYLKDYEFAMLVGEPSGGGACPVSFYMLETGSLIGYSSQLCIRGLDGRKIEEGLIPDIDYSPGVEGYKVDDIVNLIREQ